MTIRNLSLNLDFKNLDYMCFVGWDVCYALVVVYDRIYVAVKIGR